MRASSPAGSAAAASRAAALQNCRRSPFPALSRGTLPPSPASAPAAIIAAIRDDILHGLFRGAAIIAQIEQRGDHVGLEPRAPRGRDVLRLRRSMAASLSRNSTTMRSAVLRPTPGMRVSRTRSPARIAGTNSSTLMPERIFSASDGPTPEADMQQLE